MCIRIYKPRLMFWMQIILESARLISYWDLEVLVHIFGTNDLDNLRRS